MASELVKALANLGLGEAASQLKSLKSSNDLEKLALDAMSQAIDKHGADGVNLAVDLVTRLGDGGELKRKDIKAVGLRAGSDLLAAMQKAEAKERKAAVDLATKVGSVLGPVLKAVVLSII